MRELPLASRHGDQERQTQFPTWLTFWSFRRFHPSLDVSKAVLPCRPMAVLPRNGTRIGTYTSNRAMFDDPACDTLS